MKTNWLPYVAVVAALVAGSICSTAFAGGPGGFKFGGSGGGGNAIRSLSNGNSNGNNAIHVNKNLGIQLQSGIQGGNQPRISNLNGNLGVVGGSHNTQIKKMPGTLNGNIGQVLGGGSNSSQPKIHINPGVIKSGNLNGILGGGNGNGNGIPKLGKIDPGFNKNGIGQAVGNILGGNGNGNGNGQKNIQCSPCKIGCKPWWWDCHSCYHDHCYKPCYPVIYTQPIIVQVPVVVDVAQPVMQVPAAATLTLQSPGLGDVAGQVMIQVDKLAIPAMVNDWKNDAVTMTLPMLGIGGQVIADIVIVRADGSVANSIKVELVNAQPQAQAAGVQQAGFQGTQSLPADQAGAAAALTGLSQ